MNPTLNAKVRSGRGKNLARELRRNGQLPGVVYGDLGGSSTDGAVAVSVDPDVIVQILRSDSGANTLIGLTVDGGEANQVLIKDYQLNPITHSLLHVDFYRVAMDKVITVAVPVELSGEAEGVKVQGGLVDFVTREIAIECLPSEIPERLVVDVSSLTIGQGVRVRDLLEGVSWEPVTDTETLVVHVIAPKLEEEEETTDEEAAVEGEEGGAEAEGEGAASESETAGDQGDKSGD